MRSSRRCYGARGGKELDPPFRNPFVHELRFTPLQKAKIALMTVTLFPIRLLFAAFMMLLAWPFAFVATVGRSEDTVEPECWWRRVVDVVLKAIMRTMWFAGGFHWVTVKGRQALPSEAPILTLAPHSSYFDAIPVTMTMASIVMKAESKDIPVWGTLIKFIRPVFVSRSDQDSRRKTVEEIKRRAHSGGEWPQIMIFPEGTCTNRSCLITFKPGAFIPAVPVQPVVLRYPNELVRATIPLNTYQEDLKCILFSHSFKILWLTLCQLQNQVVIEFLPIYTPSEEEKSNPALFANNVRSIMAKALGVPVTDYSFEDCQLAMAEGLLRLPGNTRLLEFAKLIRSLGLKPQNTEEELEQYASRARKVREERLGLEDLAHYLNVPVSDTLGEMLSYFEPEDGKMDIRLYVIALSVVCRPSKTLQTVKLAFKMFEAEDDNTVREGELACILKAALGVRELNAAPLFGAVDGGGKERITFDEFKAFAEQHPDFAWDYLYPNQEGFHSCPDTPSSAPVANGFCMDFTSKDVQPDRNPSQKKVD
uniref:Lysophosphatidylcholine acyltransferase 1 n=1 Tax=Scleropages formosus TaxID=113540 RepID=A0A8C9SM14_SCLFO